MDTHAWINTVAIGLSLCVTLFLATRSQIRIDQRELAEIKVKVETMWSFLLRRGVVEGVDRGMLTINSPVLLTPSSARIMESLRVELQKFRKEECPDCNEQELAMKIEVKFGSRLVHEICLPNELSFGVCLLIATAVAKGEHALTEILDKYIPSKA